MAATVSGVASDPAMAVEMRIRDRLYCRLAEGVDTAESEGRRATDLLKCRDLSLIHI